jgi:hypothetical protein
MLYYRFQYHSSSRIQAFSIIPPRPITLIGRNQSPVKGITYWYRPHTSKTKLPVVFFHGIGIGLYPYVNFLTELSKQSKDADGEVGIIAVELMPVSFRVTGAVLAKEELCRRLLTVLKHHQFEEFVLVSHS